MIAPPVRESDARSAAARGRAVLASVRAGEVCIAASVVRGPAVVLGARQRPTAIVREGGWVHRASTGVEVFVEDVAVWWSLGLPSVTSLFADATGETLINRNVRGFLRGFTACGALAHYLGRDFISVQRRAGATLGYDVTADGCVLLEVIAGWSHPLDLPPTLRAASSGVPRAPGGLALRELATCGGPEIFAQRVIEAVAHRSGQTLRAVPELDEIDVGTPWREPTLRGAVRVPIGRVEAGEVEGVPWLGGDLLASTAWLHRFELALARHEDPPCDGVMHGARPEDLQRAWSGAEISP